MGTSVSKYTVNRHNVSKTLAESTIKVIVTRQSSVDDDSSIKVVGSDNVVVGLLSFNVKALQKINTNEIKQSKTAMAGEFATKVLTAMGASAKGAATSVTIADVKRTTENFISTISSLSSSESIKNKVDIQTSVSVKDSSHVVIKGTSNNLDLKQMTDALAADLSSSSNFEAFLTTLKQHLKAESKGPIAEIADRLGLTVTSIIALVLLFIFVIIIWISWPSSPSPPPYYQPSMMGGGPPTQLSQITFGPLGPVC